MVTIQELQEARENLEAERRRQSVVANQTIPQRKFGSRVTRQTQQTAQSNINIARQNITVIDENVREIDSTEAQIRAEENRRAEIDRQRDDFTIARRVFEQGRSPAILTKSQQRIYDEYASEKRATEEKYDVKYDQGVPIPRGAIASAVGGGFLFNEFGGKSFSKPIRAIPVASSLQGGVSFLQYNDSAKAYVIANDLEGTNLVYGSAESFFKNKRPVLGAIEFGIAKTAKFAFDLSEQLGRGKNPISVRKEAFDITQEKTLGRLAVGGIIGSFFTPARTVTTVALGAESIYLLGTKRGRGILSFEGEQTSKTLKQYDINLTPKQATIGIGALEVAGLGLTGFELKQVITQRTAKPFLLTLTKSQDVTDTIRFETQIPGVFASSPFPEGTRATATIGEFAYGYKSFFGTKILGVGRTAQPIISFSLPSASGLEIFTETRVNKILPGGTETIDFYKTLANAEETVIPTANVFTKSKGKLNYELLEQQLTLRIKRTVSTGNVRSGELPGGSIISFGESRGALQLSRSPTSLTNPKFLELFGRSVTRSRRLDNGAQLITGEFSANTLTKKGAVFGFDISDLRETKGYSFVRGGGRRSSPAYIQSLYKTVVSAPATAGFVAEAGARSSPLIASSLSQLTRGGSSRIGRTFASLSKLQITRTTTQAGAFGFRLKDEQSSLFRQQLVPRTQSRSRSSQANSLASFNIEREAQQFRFRLRTGQPLKQPSGSNTRLETPNFRNPPNTFNFALLPPFGFGQRKAKSKKRRRKGAGSSFSSAFVIPDLESVAFGFRRGYTTKSAFKEATGFKSGFALRPIPVRLR